MAVTALLWCWITMLYLPVMKSLPGTDAGVFSAVGLELLHGSTLYSEVFESKLPGIFLWNALALGVLDMGYVSVRYAEWIFLMLLAPVLLNMMRAFRLKLPTAFVFAGWFYFLWLQPFVFGSGNQTETLAVGLLIAGVGIGVRQTRYRYHLLSALLLGTSFWFREQVALAAAVYFLWLTFTLSARKRIWMFLAAAFPSALILIWMHFNGSLEAWWSHYPDYLRQYYAFAREETAHFNTWSRWSGIIWNHFLHRQWGILMWTILSLVMAWHPRVRLATRNLSVISFFLLLFHLWLTLKSGYMFGHYFQLILLEWMLLLFWIPLWMSGLKWPDRFSLAMKWSTIPATLIFLLMLLPVLIPRMGQYKLLLPRPYTTDVFTHHIRENIRPNEGIYVDAAAFGQYYADTGIPSGLVFPVPVFHYYTLRVFGNFPERNAEKQMEKLQKNPPRFIILDQDYSLMFYRGQGIDWFDAYYHLLELSSEYNPGLRLYERKVQNAEHIK